MTGVGIIPDFLIHRRGEEGMIAPFSGEQVQTASYDVRLGQELLVPQARQAQILDLGEKLDIQYESIQLGEVGIFALASQRFVLGVTQERLDLPNDVACRIEGKSSLAKAGLQIHSAGHAAPGFQGFITLEMVNLGESIILLRPGVLIAQLVFEQLSTACRNPYRGRYQGSQGPAGYRPEKES